MLKRSDVEKLYALSALKHDYGVKAYQSHCGEKIEDNEWFRKRESVDVVINDLLTNISNESDDGCEVGTALFVARLFDVIGNKSISRCMKVLEVLGVELDEA